MRKDRQIRNRRKRSRRGPLELDITSLLDILVILLIFLLQSYNSSGIVFNVNQDIDLPISASKNPNTAGVIVQVSPTNIIVDNKVVLQSDNLPPRVYDMGRRRIVPLFEALNAKREQVKVLEKTANTKPFSGIINFVVDKTLGYNYIKKLLFTAAEAGYFRFNFVVLGDEF